MDRDGLKSFLELEIIWKDDYALALEVKVTASNGRYSGTTEVYDTSESLLGFAQTLIGFPKDEKEVFYEVGKRDGYAYFSINFYCLDKAGRIGVEINLESHGETEYTFEKKDKLKLDIVVEPSGIDDFLKQLNQLATSETGIAILCGRDAYK